MPLAKAHLRHKLVLGHEALVVANLEDLGQALHITQNITGMPSYKLAFYKEVFIPLYKSKPRPTKLRNMFFHMEMHSNKPVIEVSKLWNI
jgi:hypothetical protein